MDKTKNNLKVHMSSKDAEIVEVTKWGRRKKQNQKVIWPERNLITV